MRPDLDAALVRDFPNLYRDRHGRSRDTRMCDGFPRDGWEPIIRRLSEKLEPIARETGLRALQVKEKFATLRFYVGYEDGSRIVPAEVCAAIAVAERESARTCERCGAPGRLSRVGGWYLTLCDVCRAREDGQLAERGRRPRHKPVVPPGTRVWLDDVRPAPEGWIWVLWPQHAVGMLATGNVAELSLDHDLGDDDFYGTGYDVLVWVEEQVALHDFVPPKIHIHSANVVGRERMQRALESIDRLRRGGGSR